MSNSARNRARTRTTPAAGAAAGAPRSRGVRSLWVWAVVAAVVALVAVVAVVSTRGGDDDAGGGGGSATTATPGGPGTTGDAGSGSATAGDPSSTVPGGAAGPVAENQPVTIDGTPLVRLPKGDDPALGTTAPEVHGASFDGTPVDVVADGTPRLIAVLAHWCPHCNAEVPRLVAWEQSGRVPEGLEVVAVSTGVHQGAPNYPPSQWLQDKGWPWAVLADNQEQSAAIAYGTSVYPFLVVLDGDGVVRARHGGEFPDVDAIDEFVRAALD